MKLFLKQLLLLLCASLTMIPVKSFANFEFNDAEVNAVIMQSVFQRRILKSHLKYAGSEWVLFHRVYKLRFEDGTIVEFDIEGDWLYVSSDDEDFTIEQSSEYATSTASYNDYEDTIKNDALAEAIKIALTSLSEREKIIICMSTGYGYDREYKDNEIADAIGLTSERVRQLRHSATKKFAQVYNPIAR
jgi:DNA-directed RNA polymerase specialized sigma24 family protein